MKGSLQLFIETLTFQWRGSTKREYSFLKDVFGALRRGGEVASLQREKLPPGHKKKGGKKTPA